jgi:hypothetical protein
LGHSWATEAWVPIVHVNGLSCPDAMRLHLHTSDEQHGLSVHWPRRRVSASRP